MRLMVEPSLCTGCRSCELACAFGHGAEGQPGASRCATVTVGPDEHVPMLCLQCEHAACVQVCPVEALSLDDRGIVQLDRDRCIECMACVVACPFGNMHFDAVRGELHKCDLCTGHGDRPRCAMFCPTHALWVEE